MVQTLQMPCAWETLASFSRNDRRLAAPPSAVGVLHIQNRRLDFHLHVHMVMPAAALDTQRGLWRTKCRRSKAQVALPEVAGVKRAALQPRC